MEGVIRKKTRWIIKIVKIIQRVTINIQKISPGFKRVPERVNVQKTKLLRPIRRWDCDWIADKKP